jgi:hypothetical protein
VGWGWRRSPSRPGSWPPASRLAGQSAVALGSEEERARLLAAASVILLFRTPQPSELAALAGTERVAEGAWQVDGEELTGRQTVTMRSLARVD